MLPCLGILTLILVLTLHGAMGSVVVLWEAQTQLALTHSSTSQPGPCWNLHQEAVSPSDCVLQTRLFCRPSLVLSDRSGGLSTLLSFTSSCKGLCYPSPQTGATAEIIVAHGLQWTSLRVLKFIYEAFRQQILSATVFPPCYFFYLPLPRWSETLQLHGIQEIQTCLQVSHYHMHKKAEWIFISFSMCTEWEVNRENSFSGFQSTVGFCGLVQGEGGLVCVFFLFWHKCPWFCSRKLIDSPLQTSYICSDFYSYFEFLFCNSIWIKNPLEGAILRCNIDLIVADHSIFFP